MALYPSRGYTPGVHFGGPAPTEAQRALWARNEREKCLKREAFEREWNSRIAERGKKKSKKKKKKKKKKKLISTP